MQRPVVIVGLGQMGGTFAHGLLRMGHPVVPVTRETRSTDVEREVDPLLCLIAVGEAALAGALASLPSSWRDRVALLQNELWPASWHAHEIVDPTVAVVWFEKKATTAVRAILPTPIAGPRAELLVRALAELGIPAESIPQDRLLFELALKYLYILTANVAGLEVGGTVGALFCDHRALATRVASEVLAIGSLQAGASLPREELLHRLEEAFAAHPDHACTGRTARERLERARARAHQAGLRTPELDRIASLGGRS